MYYNSYLKFIIFILAIHALLSCNQEQQPTKRYVFLGHCYQWGAADNNRIDYRLESFNFKQFDQIWLGGDLCARSSERKATLHYLESHFDISAPTTHWSVGNHDIVNGNISNIEAVTGRPSFYTAWVNGLAIAVLNTTFNHPQLSTSDQCAELDAQFQMLQRLTDTLKTATHLILLHHHALLTNDLAEGKLDMDTLWHYYRPDLDMCCQPKGSFQELIYPMLQSIQKRGIQVILIGGDVGQRCKKFEFQTKDRIWFLGSGINNSMGKDYIPPWVTNLEPDQILLFEHEPTKNRLHWRFELLSEFIQQDSLN